MDYQTVVLLDKKTKEILACVPLDGSECICRKDVDVKIYNGTEPVFMEKGDGFVLKENTFILNL